MWKGISKRTHINSVHYGKKNHKCDPCRKSYSQAGHLKTHTNSVHNGQKDDKCDSYVEKYFLNQEI